MSIDDSLLRLLRENRGKAVSYERIVKKLFDPNWR